jgi:hypothetical protein
MFHYSYHCSRVFIDFMILWLRGENGTGPAKFNIPHSVTLDAVGRVKPVSLCLELCGCGWVGWWARLGVCVLFLFLLL